MLSKIDSAMSSHFSGMDKKNADGCLTYSGAVELEGVVAGVSMLFFEGGFARAIVQLTEVKESFSAQILRLCAKINRDATYKATLDEGVFALSLDMFIGDDFSAELISEAFYSVIEGARIYHIKELREILGELSNVIPPADSELLN